MTTIESAYMTHLFVLEPRHACTGNVFTYDMVL